MKEHAVRKFLGIFILFAASVFAGCPALEQLGGPGGLGGYGGAGTNGNDVIGEVEYIDPRSREIEVRTDRGRTAIMRYDDRTQVIYRQRNYSVSNLEQGDYIVARVRQDRDGRDYTDTITVRESVQDRSGRGSGGSGGSVSSRFDRVDGRVEYIDARRGTFELRDSRNRMVLVSVPFNAPRQVIDRYNRLREGDQVRIEGRSVGTDRFELDNFL
jgi:hypothetical protein